MGTLSRLVVAELRRARRTDAQGNESQMLSSWSNPARVPECARIADRGNQYFARGVMMCPAPAKKCSKQEYQCCDKIAARSGRLRTRGECDLRPCSAASIRKLEPAIAEFSASIHVSSEENNIIAAPPGRPRGLHLVRRLIIRLSLDQRNALAGKTNRPRRFHQRAPPSSLSELWTSAVTAANERCACS